MTLAVLGAGPHGQEIAALWEGDLYDDCLPGYDPCREGAFRHHRYIAGAVWPNVRRRIARDADQWAKEIGPIVFPGAHISPRARLGRQVHVLYNAVVSHGCRLGDFVTVCAGAVLAGEVIVEDDVFIGANATVIHGGITIGQGALVGAGAVVTRDVKPRETVAGVPAKCLA